MNRFFVTEYFCFEILISDYVKICNYLRDVGKLFITILRQRGKVVKRSITISPRLDTVNRKDRANINNNEAPVVIAVNITEK